MFFCSINPAINNKSVVLPQEKLCDATAVLFGLKFANAFTVTLRVAKLQSSKHVGTKQNRMENGD